MWLSASPEGRVPVSPAADRMACAALPRQSWQEIGVVLMPLTWCHLGERTPCCVRQPVPCSALMRENLPAAAKGSVFCFLNKNCVGLCATIPSRTFSTRKKKKVDGSSRRALGTDWGAALKGIWARLELPEATGQRCQQEVCNLWVGAPLSTFLPSFPSFSIF